MKVKRVLQREFKCEVTYIEEVKNFDIITEKMNDAFTPYRVDQNVMMWLDEDGLLGEIECIFPAQIDNEIILGEKNGVMIQSGFQS